MTMPVQPPLAERLRREVLQLYAEVDRAVAAAGPICIASGRCCRFREYGHTLFLSSLEADLLLAAAPRRDDPASPESCPFQKENLCTAREPRPLGCRIFFCDPSYTETGNRLTEEALTRLKELAESYGVPWQYAPLHHFLNTPVSRSPRLIPPALPGP